MLATVTGKARTFDMTPPPLETAILSQAGPGGAVSAALIDAVSWVLLMNVVLRGDPFQSTVDPDTKPVPLTVNVNAGPPAATAAGETEVTASGGAAGAVTVWISVEEVLAVKVASPSYCAVMECEPMPSEEILSVAWPELFNVPLPSSKLPSKNVAIPVGVPAAVVVTVAVNVTDWPRGEVLPLEEEFSAVTVALVPALLTVCMNVAEELGAKAVSPSYCAVRRCDPIAREDRTRVPCPLEFNVPVPIETPLSKNVTFPVGITVPEPCATAAVSVTDWPKKETG